MSIDNPQPIIDSESNLLGEQIKSRNFDEKETKILIENGKNKKRALKRPSN